jgi:ligand-binding sensor domain-containing protein/signal transduction histidine kinase/CheY-like chemotaxis protein/AraC-like DNA-binding protein
MKPSILLLIIMLTQLFCKGQDLVFNHLMTENGLSQNSIFAIAQDSRGFMWYGSRYGLNRYDGSRFRLYKNIPADKTSLSNEYIFALHCDTKGVLWVGTIGGLSKFNPETNTFDKIDLGNAPAYIIRTISEDKKGRVWVGTDHGLYLLTNRNTSKFIPAYQMGLPKEIAVSEVLSIFEDHKGFLWIGTSKGLIKSVVDKQFKVIKVFTKSNSPGSISDNAVTAIAEDSQQNLWFGTENGGLNLLNETTGTFSRFLHEEGNSNSMVHNAVRKIIKTKTGQLWIGTLEGLSVLDPATKQFSTFQHRKSNPKSLNQNSIYSLYEDKNGSVWIGTYYGGVNVVYASPTRFNVWQHNEKSPNLNHNVVSSITEDATNRLWIGTEGGGLNYYDWSNKGFGAYTFAANDTGSLGSSLVKVVYRDKTNQIWVGTHGGGLNLFNPLTGKFKRFLSGKDHLSSRSEIMALLEDDDNRLWVASQTGLHIFNKTGNSLQPYPIPEKLKIFKDKNIKSLFEDSNDNIWISSTSGLYRYTSKTNTLQLIRLLKASKEINTISGFVNCWYEDIKGNLWMGLYYTGLARYDTQKQSLSDLYTTKEGLSNDNVLGILADEQQQLWISTSNGLSKLNLAVRSFQTYTISDGLAGNEFNYNSFFKSNDGAMFFGGFNGLTWFFPKEIQKNNFQAPIVFTGLLLFNKPVEIGTPDRLLQHDIGFTPKLVFKHDQNVFTIQFALLNYIKSRKNKYAYKLEGINQQWIESSTPAATYTNLPSGTYTLLVKGANNDGVWSKPASITIEILPPFWKTWWAFCLYAILVTIVIFFITRFFYLRQLLVKDEELHQTKLNFFTNVSHEIRTHLTLIMAPIEKLLDGNPGDSTTNRQLYNVKNNADRLLKLTTELMDFRKAETSHLNLHVQAYNLVTFIQQTARSFEDLSEKKRIHFSSGYDQDAIIVYFDKEQLEKVFINLISNAFKFTPAGGSITVDIKPQDDRVIVTVNDTGRGIAPEYLDKLFTNFFQVYDHSIQNTGYGIGLALSKHIVELHKGIISVSSTPATAQQPGYTSFAVTLLKGARHFINTPYLQAPVSVSTPSLKENEPVQAVEPATPATHTGIKKYTVLIVEDNAELRALIKDTLVTDYEVLLAKDGLDGWGKATEEIPDLIISDVMMPRMDGFTLCNQLKTDERTSHIPVILLTAKSSETDHISGLSGGTDQYLTKPFSSKILQLQVRNLLAGRETMRQKFSKELVLGPQQIVVAPVEEQFLSKLIQIIENNMKNEYFGVEQLAEGIGMSQSVLYKKVKALTNMSVNDFSKSIRLKRAAQLLAQKQYTVYEIGYIVGFSDRKYFSKEFKKQFGKTPSEYLKP